MSVCPTVEGLPAPHDDGAADHLPGSLLPVLTLPATEGSRVALDGLTARTVIFVHPSIGGIYPVFPPDRGAEQALAWLATHPLS